jgi:uncharacterized membrane protein
MIKVTVYTKDDCQLCESALSDLKTLQAAVPHKLNLVDINGNTELQQAFGLDIPVIEVGPYKLKAPFSFQDLEITLRAAVEREKHIDSIDKSIEEGSASLPVEVSRADRFSYWLSRRYMLVLNLVVLLYVGLPFLAPVLMVTGVTGPAKLIYNAYGYVCHQLAFRSWFLFGEQPAYPRQAAVVDSLTPYGSAIGLSEEDQVAARQFIGNPTIGYKVAFCQRDVAIYGGILLFGTVFSLTGKRLRSLPWYIWILVGILPIGLDGLSQLLSQPPISLFPYRESTPVLRTVTGLLFGITTAWFGYPLVEETMVDIRQYTEKKMRWQSAQKLAVREEHAVPPT